MHTYMIGCSMADRRTPINEVRLYCLLCMRVLYMRFTCPCSYQGTLQILDTVFLYPWPVTVLPLYTWPCTAYFNLFATLYRVRGDSIWHIVFKCLRIDFRITMHVSRRDFRLLISWTNQFILNKNNS